MVITGSVALQDASARNSGHSQTSSKKDRQCRQFAEGRSGMPGAFPSLCPTGCGPNLVASPHPQPPPPTPPTRPKCGTTWVATLPPPTGAPQSWRTWSTTYVWTHVLPAGRVPDVRHGSATFLLLFRVFPPRLLEQPKQQMKPKRRTPIQNVTQITTKNSKHNWVLEGGFKKGPKTSRRVQKCSGGIPGHSWPAHAQGRVLRKSHPRCVSGARICTRCLS